VGRRGLYLGESLEQIIHKRRRDGYWPYSIVTSTPCPLGYTAFSSFIVLAVTAVMRENRVENGRPLLP